MKKLALLLLLPAILFGSKILSYNIYDRHDHVDVMLTFDTPYEGVLRQNRQGDVIVIKLEAATIDTPIAKEVTSNFLQKLSILDRNTDRGRTRPCLAMTRVPGNCRHRRPR